MNRVQQTVERARFGALFLVFFVTLWLCHARAILDPPYWDALSGLFVQAHWQATHSLSPFDLLAHSAGFNEGGACVYPFSVQPPLVALFERFGASVDATLVAFHILSFAAGAVILTAVFSVTRQAIGVGLAACATLAVATLPPFRALVAQVNMDIVLAAFTLLAFCAVNSRRPRTAVVWAACALLVKPTGVIVVVALAGMLVLRKFRPAWFATETSEAHRITGALVGLAGLFVVFVVELAVVAHYGKSPPGVSLFGGALPFLSKRLWTLPEFGLALVALFALTPWIARRVQCGAARPIEIDGLVFTGAFVGFYCQYENVLPRYFVQCFPILIVALATATATLLPRTVVVVGLLAFAAFGLVNARGRFHPTKLADWNLPEDQGVLVSNDGWLLERSLEYQDDLALNRAIAARCEALRDEVVVASWPLLQMLCEPRFGYVTTPVQLAAAETALEWSSPPIEIGSRSRDRSNFVRVVSPNVYASEVSRVRPGDEIVETFAVGRLRAFLLRRPSDSGASRR
ncbi:MAG: glycosyltransferase family 39 protein [Planctomycetota bacterium]|nr:glycosyltransferase family 39 protein [Planctomycetota bacterium]